MRTFSWSVPRLALFALVSLSLFHAAAGSVFAQQTSTPQANMAIEVDVQKLLDSKFAKSIDLRDSLERQMPGDVQAFLKSKTIRAVMAVPNSLDAIQNSGGSNPVDFYAELTFDESEAFEALKDKIVNDSDKEEKGGVTYYTPKNGDTQMYAVFGDKKVTLATQSYSLGEANFGKVTPAAKAAWEKAPKTPLRMVMDMDSIRQLLDEATEEAEANLPPMAAPFLRIPSYISQLQLTADLDQSEMMTMKFESGDEENAKQLQESLRALVGAGKAALMQAPAGDPTVATVRKVLDTMKPQASGKTVTLSLSQGAGN